MSQDRFSAREQAVAGWGEADADEAQGQRQGRDELLEQSLDAGRLACRFGDFDSAVELADQVLDLVGSDELLRASQAALLLGFAHAGRGEEELARLSLAVGVKGLDPTLPSPFLSPALFLWGWLSLEAGAVSMARVASAGLAARLLVASSPRDRALCRWLGACLERADGRLDAAIHSAQELLTALRHHRRPSEAALLTMDLVSWLLEAGRGEEAARLCDEASGFSAETLRERLTALVPLLL